MATRAPREYVCFTANTSSECNESYYSYTATATYNYHYCLLHCTWPAATSLLRRRRRAPAARRARRVGAALLREDLCEGEARVARPEWAVQGGL